MFSEYIAEFKLKRATEYYALYSNPATYYYLWVIDNIELYNLVLARNCCQYSIGKLHNLNQYGILTKQNTLLDLEKEIKEALSTYLDLKNKGIDIDYYLTLV